MRIKQYITKNIKTYKNQYNFIFFTQTMRTFHQNISNSIQNQIKGVKGITQRCHRSNQHYNKHKTQIATSYYLFKSTRLSYNKTMLSQEKAITKVNINGQDIQNNFNTSNKQQKRVLKTIDYSFREDQNLSKQKSKFPSYFSPRNKPIQFYIHNKIWNQNYSSTSAKIANIQTCRKQLEQKIANERKSNRSQTNGHSSPRKAQFSHKHQHILKIRKLNYTKNKIRELFKSNNFGQGKVKDLISKRHVAVSVFKKNNTQQLEDTLLEKNQKSLNSFHRKNPQKKKLKTNIEKKVLDKLWSTSLDPWSAENEEEDYE